MTATARHQPSRQMQWMWLCYSIPENRKNPPFCPGRVASPLHTQAQCHSFIKAGGNADLGMPNGFEHSSRQKKNRKKLGQNGKSVIAINERGKAGIFCSKNGIYYKANSISAQLCASDLAPKIGDLKFVAAMLLAFKNESFVVILTNSIPSRLSLVIWKSLFSGPAAAIFYHKSRQLTWSSFRFIETLSLPFDAVPQIVSLFLENWPQTDTKKSERERDKGDNWAFLRGDQHRRRHRHKGNVCGI